MKQAGLRFIIQDKKQLTALTSSARQEIVDVLSQMRTVSVGELAATLGRPADALYYHLRVLKQAGLVLRAGADFFGGDPAPGTVVLAGADAAGRCDGAADRA